MRSTVVFMLLLPFQFICAQNKLDLYKQMALENNLKLKVLFYDYQSALQRVQQVGALPDPQLAFGYFISAPETKLGPQQTKISLLQMFPWFGTLSLKEDVATIQAKIKFEKFNHYKNEITFQVEQAWYKLCEIEIKIKLTSDNIQILNTFEKLAFKKYETAKIQMVDILRIKMMKDDIEEKIHSLRDAMEIAKIKFNRLLNRSIDMDVLLSEHFYDHALVGKIDNFEDNPSVKMSKHQLEVQQKMEHLADKNHYPAMGVKLDYIFVGENTMPDGGRDIIMPMLSVSIPFFSSKYSAQKQEAIMMQQMASKNLENVAQDIRSQYKEVQIKIANAVNKINLYQKQLKKSNQALKLLLQSYITSSKDFEEVLKMQQRILQYQMDDAKAKREVMVQKSKIKFLKGI